MYPACQDEWQAYIIESGRRILTCGFRDGCYDAGAVFYDVFYDAGAVFRNVSYDTLRTCSHNRPTVHAELKLEVLLL